MPIISIANAETGEIVEREMNEQELLAYDAHLEKHKKLKAEREKQEIEQSAKKEALLERLGITEEEAKLLLS